MSDYERLQKNAKHIKSKRPLMEYAQEMTKQNANYVLLIFDTN